MDAFNEIAKQYTPMIYKVIHSLKIFKEYDHYFNIGLQALWEANSKYDGSKAAFSTFAYAVIRGRLLNELRKESQWEKRNQMITPEQLESNNVSVYIDTYLEMEVLNEYCHTLTENQKHWVIHTFLFNHSLDEIAELYAVSNVAVKSWRRIALQKLRRELYQKD